MSDFLQFKDEILDGEPKFNITDNADGTKNIELATEVIQEGSNLNQNLLQKINCIMGYNDMTYTEETRTITSYLSDFVSSINLIDNISSSSSTYKNVINWKPTNTSQTFDIQYKIQTLSKTISVRNRGFSKTLIDKIGVSKTYTFNEGFLDDINARTTATQNIMLKLNANGIKIKNMVLLACGSGSKSANFYDDEMNLIGSTNFPSGGSDSHAGTYGTPIEYKFNEYKNLEYIELIFVGNNDSHGQGFGMQITKYSIPETTTCNICTINNVDNLQDENRILKIYTPEFVNNQICIINDLTCDTILQNNKYYELVKNNTNNILIAEEVRV